MSGEARRIPFAKSKPEDEAGDGLWNAYLDAVDDGDKVSVESWNGSTTGILAFTGLFAATVAAFVIESYKMLQPDANAQTVALLAQLVLAHNVTPAVPASEVQSGSFQASETAIAVNALWFLSLTISLISALLATLIQEWTRDFLRDVRRRSSETTIKEYAFNHIYVRQGVERYRLDYVTTLVVILLHAAVAIFLVGLILLLFPIHHVPAWVVIATVSIAAALYILISAIPFWDNSCPYRTPATYWFIFVGWAAMSAFFASILPFWLISESLWKNNWSWIRKGGIRGLLTKIITLGRILFYYARLLPTRSLPGRYKAPAYIPSYLSPDVLIDSEDQEFVDVSRLTFIWHHTSEHMRSPNGTAILFNYLPLRLLNSASHDFGFFFVHLRHRTSFMEHIGHNMTSIRTLSDGIGSLKLLRMLLVAEHTISGGLNLGGIDADGRWEAMNSIFSAFREYIQLLSSVNDHARRNGDYTMLVELSSFRWTLLVVRTNLLRDRQDEDIAVLDKMLMELEEVKGFRLLSLYSEAPGLASIDFDGYRGDQTWTHELAARNALTFLAHIVCAQSPLAIAEGNWPMPESPYPPKNIPDLCHWHQFFKPAEVAGDTRGRRRASHLVSSLLQRVSDNLGDGTWDGEPSEGMYLLLDVLEHLKGIVLLPELPHPDLVSLDEEMRDLGIIISPHPSPTSMNPSLLPNTVTLQTDTASQVQLDLTDIDSPTMRAPSIVTRTDPPNMLLALKSNDDIALVSQVKLEVQTEFTCSDERTALVGISAQADRTGDNGVLPIPTGVTREGTKGPFSDDNSEPLQTGDSSAPLAEAAFVTGPPFPTPQLSHLARDGDVLLVTTAQHILDGEGGSPGSPALRLAEEGALSVGDQGT